MRTAPQFAVWPRLSPCYKVALRNLRQDTTPLRIFTAALATETNTFAPIWIDRRAFEASLYAPPGQHPPTPTLCTAPITVGRELAKTHGFTLIEGTAAWADPAGPLNRQAYESLRDEILAQLRAALPLDAVVLIGGCDKTIPAELMGAISADMPAIVVNVGSMLAGRHEGARLGACTDCRRLWAAYRAGSLDGPNLDRAHDQLMPTSGTCMVMGTASTMAVLADTLGFMLPGSATAPAVSPRPASASVSLAGRIVLSGS